MSSKEFVFEPSETISASIRGTAQRYPVKRIFCVGRNYMAHAAEMGTTVDKSKQEPFYFTKSATALVPSGSSVKYPPGTDNYHYEMELVVAIGKAGFEIDEARAGDYIFGYACGLDMTRRDLQLKARESGRPWDLGKDFEQSAVLAPIVPVQEIVPVQDIGLIGSSKIELSVNGDIKQSSNTELLIWSVPEILAHLSRFYHLAPGDLIYTGTPEGVGPVSAGDKIHGSIAGLADIELEIQ